MAEAPAASSDPRIADVKETREAAKWLIATFGAIAAVIVAGISLANLGSIEMTSARFIAAIVGLGASAWGVVWVIGNAADVLVVDPVTLRDLESISPEDATAVDASVLGPAGSAQCLADEIPRKNRAAQEAYEALLNNISSNRAGPLQTAYDVALARAQAWSQAGQSTVVSIKNERVRRAFLKLRKLLWLKVALVLVGVATVAWGIGSKSEDTTIGVVTATPTEVVVQFTKAGSKNDELKSKLGEDCVTSTGVVRAVALQSKGAEYTLAVLPSKECTANVVTVAPTEAKVGLPPKDSG